LNLTLNFGNQNSVGYYTKNIQKGGKISFAIEFVYYIYIYNDYNILAIMMMMDDDIKEKQYQQEQRLFTFIIAYVVLIYIVISIS